MIVSLRLDSEILYITSAKAETTGTSLTRTGEGGCKVLLLS